MKKALSVLLSLVMALSLSVTAFAENISATDADAYFEAYANDFEQYASQKNVGSFCYYS